MQSFYKVAWQVLFAIFYPFITLFSLLFIGLVNVISWISRLLASPNTEPDVDALQAADWAPFIDFKGGSISGKAVHEVQFGPLVYRLRARPANAAIQEGYWGDFAQQVAGGVLLQRWPSISEHELERFELVYFDPASQQLQVLCEMPTFYWETAKEADGSLVVYWNDRRESYTVALQQLA
jgi:hypothetical protein